MFTITTTIDCYLLPADGKAAEAVFLQHIKDPHEMWIIAYSFTLVPMIDEIIANNQLGDPYHIYLDLSQSSGKAEKPQIQRLVDAGVEVTIGTSPAGSAYITHTKGLVCDDSPPLCWEGSVNFSASGWLQVNTAMVFSSQQWRDQFVAQFNQLRDYAWTNLRSSQLLKSPPKGVTIGPSVDPSAPNAPAGFGKSKSGGGKKKTKSSSAGASKKLKKAASGKKSTKPKNAGAAKTHSSSKKSASSKTKKKAKKSSKK